MKEIAIPTSTKIYVPEFESDIGDTITSIEWNTAKGGPASWDQDHTNMRRIWINGKVACRFRCRLRLLIK